MLLCWYQSLNQPTVRQHCDQCQWPHRTPSVSGTKTSSTWQSNPDRAHFLRAGSWAAHRPYPKTGHEPALGGCSSSRATGRGNPRNAHPCPWCGRGGRGRWRRGKWAGKGAELDVISGGAYPTHHHQRPPEWHPPGQKLLSRRAELCFDLSENPRPEPWSSQWTTITHPGGREAGSVRDVASPHPHCPNHNLTNKPALWLTAWLSCRTSPVSLQTHPWNQLALGHQGVNTVRAGSLRQMTCSVDMFTPAYMCFLFHVFEQGAGKNKAVVEHNSGICPHWVT